MKRKKLENMTRAEARVAIAKDVLAQIRLGRYLATPGIYIGVEVLHAMWGANDLEGRVAATQRRCDDPGLRCAVCARGAAVVSGARVFDDRVTRALAKGADGGDGSVALRGIFSYAQLQRMEDAFELFEHRDPDVAAWGARWPSAADRLEAIWTNVRENNGTFRLSWSPSPRSRLGRAAASEEAPCAT